MNLVLSGKKPKTWQYTSTTNSGGNVVFQRTSASTGSYIATVTALNLTDYTWDKDKGIESNTYSLLATSEIADSASLMQNTPNPFNPETWIPYTLPNQEHVIIKIYDISGRMVRTLDLGRKSPGAYVGKDKAAYWDGTNESGEQVSSGIYFYSMEAGKFRASKRMLIIR